MKLKCKGFVLLETLIVAIFVVGIFIFLYSSVIPLLGVYENLTEENNIDIVYKLFHIRKSLSQDNNYATIIAPEYGSITCNDFTNTNYCNKLLNSDYLNLEEYELFYVKNITSNSVKNTIKTLNISSKLKKYIANYKDDINDIILLHDKSNNSIAYLILPEPTAPLLNEEELPLIEEELPLTEEELFLNDIDEEIIF